jgi:amidohydrolase
MVCFPLCNFGICCQTPPPLFLSYQPNVSQACGHDFHIVSLLAAIETLLSCRDSWSGTLIFLFQPAEERGKGAGVMVADGLYDPKKHGCPIPDVVLGQHVFPMPAGIVATKPGMIMSAADSFKITVFGSGGHGSMPHCCIDPVVIASHIVVRLQTIVSREVPPNEMAVLTVGELQAGQAENIISDEAVLKLNIRSVSVPVRETILAAVKRIVKAECLAGNCPKEPLIEPISSFPLTVNDETVNSVVAKTFDEVFGENHFKNLPSVLGSEDFGILGSAVERPYCFWFFGGHDAEWYEKMKAEGKQDQIPINHSPYFAPVIQPTLRTGCDAIVVAALAFLEKAK